MSTLSWVTPTGSLASVLIGVPTSVDILAVDTANNGSTLTYTVIAGALPAGLTLTTAGTVTGTPEFSTNTNDYLTTQDYKFTVRVASSNGYVLDGRFTVTVVNDVNGDFFWVTPSGNLGTVPDGSFYSLKLEVIEVHGYPVTFSFISGTLPTGMQLLPTGYLQGVPTLLNSVVVDQSQVFSFTVRATSSVGHINDRTFNLSVTSIYGPIITPTTTFLGTYFDGTYYTQQLDVIELNPNVNITWSVVSGALPEGIVLDSEGLLSGYVQPLRLTGAFGPDGYDGNDPAPGGSGAILEFAQYDYAKYDFNQVSTSLNYNFTIQAYDGANYDLQEYVLNVVSRGDYTADNGNVTVDNTYLNVNTTNVYVPVILNTTKTLPTARQNSHYAYKIDGYDFEGDEITYSIVNTVGTFDAFSNSPGAVDLGFDDIPFDSYDPEGQTSATINLPGLVLDAQTGWIYGQLDPQNSSYEVYTFGIQVSKVKNSITYNSLPVYFSLPVLGDVNNVLEWITPINLGIINNGSISELRVEARSLAGRTDLVYSLYDRANVPIRLPQGLTLLPSGRISGRVTFETTNIDEYTTTFDGDLLTLDREYHFTVQVQTSDGTASAIQEFTVTIGVIDIEPYDNLYLEAMPEFDQRQIFNSVISNTDIFVPELIYRKDDPWFGVTEKIEMLFLPGLNPSDMNTYANAIAKNHFIKNYTFGDIETAVVLDDNYNVKYEVVYINVVDPELNANNDGPPLEINLTNIIANPYIDADSNEYKIVYPNSSENMIDRLASGIGYYDQSSLPDWMTSNQPGAKPGTFSTPKGFTRAVVLAYTIPGASKLIAYRLQNSGINFNSIDFTVDRYFLDNYYTTNFDIEAGRFTTGSETTFDSLPTRNIGGVVASVNYAIVGVPFNEINGRTVEYINSRHNGIDGIKNYKVGDTLVFAQQENFNNAGSYDGWVNYSDAWIGDNVTTGDTEGYPIVGFPYGDRSYDTNTVIPGYLERLQSTVSVLATAPAGHPTEIQVNQINTVSVGQAITFVGAPFGGISTGVTYYVRSLNTETTTTIINNIPETIYLYYMGLSTTADLASPVTLTSSAGVNSGNLISYTRANQRGGIWRINIINGIVELEPVQEVEPYQRVRVVFGKTYASSILYYTQTLSVGQTVPYYTVYRYTPPSSTSNATTFNNGTTRFFSYRDQYYTPGEHDKYIKFPQYGVFN